MKSIEIIDHPADIGVIIKTDTLAELFEESAKYMFSIIAELSTVNKKTVKEVSISDTDLPNLLINWLNELLYIFEVEDILFCNFEIENIDEKSLKAKVFGEELDLKKHTILTEVKAATYHQLDVSKKENFWQAKIIFDL